MKKLTALLLVFVLTLTATPITSYANEGDYIFEPLTGTIEGYIGITTDIVIPSTIGGIPVEHIGDYALSTYNLTSVVLPDTIKTIGEGAFSDNLLTSLTLPSSLEEIGYLAFIQNNLTTITMGNSTTVVGNNPLDFSSYAFQNAYTAGGAGTYTGTQSGLWTKVLPTNTTTYDAKVTEVESLVESEYTTESWGSFVTSINLTDLTLDATNTQAEIDAEVVKIQTALDLLVVTTGINWGMGITESIGGNTITLSGTGVMTDFSHNTNDYVLNGLGIENVIIEEGVTSIGDYAFHNTSLNSVTLPNSVTSIGEGAFLDSGLTSFVIPQNVTTIKQSSFSGNSLTSITIPASVLSIGDIAFRNNILTEITMERANTVLGDSLLDFDNNNFRNAYTLGGVGTYTGTQLGTWSKTPSTGIVWGADITESISGDTLTLSGTGAMADFPFGANTNALSGLGIENVVIEEGVTSVGNFAFPDNSLKSVTLPNSVTSIGGMAFTANSLTSFVIPQNVTTIGFSAFVANSLTSITIPSAVLTIGDSAFFNNILTEITMERADTVLADSLLASGNNNFRNAYNLGGVGTYTGTQSGGWTKVVPTNTTAYDAKVLEVNNLVELDYTVVSWSSFSTAITSIDFTLDSSNTQAEIDTEVSKIQEALDLLVVTTGINWGVDITESISGDTLTLSGTGAMTDFGLSDNANKLRTLSITEVVIGEGITHIGNSAFRNNGLISITLPDSVVNIGYGAFVSNELTSVVIPNNVTHIGDLAFEANRIRNLTIGDSVSVIGDMAFRNNELTNVTIPYNTTMIKPMAFTNNSLVTVVVERSDTFIDDHMISTMNNSFREVYQVGGAGTYTGTQGGTWSKVVPTNTIAYDAKVLEVTNLVESDYTVVIWSSFVTAINLTDLTLDATNTQAEIDAETIKIQEALDLLVVTTGINWGMGITESISGATLTLSGTGAIYHFGDGSNADKLRNLGITSVVIGEGITSIGQSAFIDNGLTYVSLPSSVTRIHVEAFTLNSLTSIILPSNLTNIDIRAFSANNITNVTIPSSVQEIGFMAFNNNHLSVINMEGADTILGDSAIGLHNDTFRDTYILGGVGTYIGTQNGSWSKLLSNVEKLAIDKQAVQTVLNNLVVTNETTSGDIFAASSGACTYATSVALLNYAKTPSTSMSTGSIIGTVRLVLGGEMENINFAKVIAQLPAPQALASSFTIAEGGNHNGLVSGDGFGLTYVLQTGPQHGTLTFNADGSYTYLAHRQPTIGFVNNDTFTFVARDMWGMDSNTATVTITLTPVNDAPSATSQSIAATIGVERNANVSATDIDGDDLNYSLVTSPQYGTVTFNSDGSYSYTATDTTQVSDSFVFKANDGLADSNNATVTINLFEAPDTTAPILTAGVVSRTSNTEGTVKFTSDEMGTYYYEVVTDGAPVPTLDTSEVGVVCTTAETTITNPIGLTAGAKDIYIVVKDGNGNVSDVLKMDVPNYTAPISSGGGSSSGGSVPITQPKEETVIVIVNGQEQDAGKETKTTENGVSSVKIEVSNKAIESKIDEAIKDNTNGAKNSIQVLVKDTTSDIAKVELTGDIIKKLEDNAFNVSLKRGTIEYVLPASEFTISKVAKDLGVLERNLRDIKLEVQITTLEDSVVNRYKEIAKANKSEILFPPVSFEVVANTTKADGKVERVKISKFNNYVERVMEIPEGVDPKTVTTGVVFNQDGTYSHVPTTVYQKDGKWFASLNSLTNSNYSIIWNPVNVASVENHWSKEAVNDMASRLVIFEPEKFEPNKAITRADFAEYLVRALGVYREDSNYENKFKDVASSGDRTLAILIANEYGIVSGYTDGNFKPDALISREEAMTMYQRAMKMTKLTGDDLTRYQNYNDFKDVSSWAEASVKEALSAHVFNGTTATTISPKSNLTYAEAAQAIRNLLVESKLIND
jgi:VCBS repeat-containing protein